MSRKRPAPGTSPSVQPSPMQPAFLYPAGVDSANLAPNDHYVNWESVAPQYHDAVPYDAGFYTPQVEPSMNPPNPADLGLLSNQLVTRSKNQQLASRTRPLDSWQDFDPSQLAPQQNTWENPDEEENLEQKALLARKDAQAKRKQIPPFVQKLSSFLDEKKNTDLIRWSDDGNSFIVLDEDEFAKTLIPELFKHNNYASFVRQLNMYGFHKKVGLSDNSMRASEKKAKTPSEYYNKYFKRGRPELLWLIQKPKNPASNPKRKRDEDKKGHGDSDDENRRYRDGADGQNRSNGEDAGAGRPQDVALVPRSELNGIRNELRIVQQQQRLISALYNKLRQQNDQLYQQATAFQALHSRHENSINAILSFLATFYNRSLEGNNGANIADMFTHAIPQNSQNQGNIVDMDDYHEQEQQKQGDKMNRSAKRPLALLPAPMLNDARGRVITATNSARNSRSPSVRTASRQSSIFRAQQPPARPQFNSTPSTGSIQEARGKPTSPPIKTDAETPDVLHQMPENDEVMSAIRNANANANIGSQGTGNPPFDLTAALAQFQNADGHSTLTPQQRNEMLNLIASNPNSPTNVLNGNNALSSPQPPPMPSLDPYNQTKAQLDVLQKMQEDQATKVQNLAERLQPLSPGGFITGLGSLVNGAGADGSYLPNQMSAGEAGDFADFIHADDYFTDAPANNLDMGNGGANGDLHIPDLELNVNDPLDLTNDYGTGDTLDTSALGVPGVDSQNGDYGMARSRVESVSSETPSSRQSVDAGANGYAGPAESPSTKRRRYS